MLFPARDVSLVFNLSAKRMVRIFPCAQPHGVIRLFAADLPTASNVCSLQRGQQDRRDAGMKHGASGSPEAIVEVCQRRFANNEDGIEGPRVSDECAAFLFHALIVWLAVVPIVTPTCSRQPR